MRVSNNSYITEFVETKVSTELQKKNTIFFIKELFLKGWNYSNDITKELKSEYLLNNFEKILDNYKCDEKIKDFIKINSNTIFNHIFTDWCNVKKFFVYNELYTYKIINRLAKKKNKVLFETTDEKQVYNVFEKFIKHIKKGDNISDFIFPEPIKEEKIIYVKINDETFITKSLNGLAKVVKEYMSDNIVNDNLEKPTICEQYLDKSFIQSLPTKELKDVVNNSIKQYKRELMNYENSLEFQKIIKNFNNGIYSLYTIRIIIQNIDPNYTLIEPMKIYN